MNLEQVAQFVKNPQELGLSHAESLKVLSDKHPYTSVYPLLYLTALSNGKSPDLDEALQQYAYKISDRIRLYHLLKGGKESVFIEEVSQSDAPDTLIDQMVSSESVPNESVEIADEIEFDIEVQGDEEPVPERKTEAEIGFDFEKVTTAHSLEQYVEVENPQEQPETIDAEETVQEELPKEAAPVKEDLKSFSSWLKSGNAEGIKPSEPVVKGKANDLIEKFIQEEPSITRSKKEFFSPSRKAKESLNEDAVPVSETLAKIYAAQGNYPKAIHVYHQLMLSIPEKKSFFAIQIEELKQKITS